MASTNPFPHANNNTDGIDGSALPHSGRPSGGRKEKKGRKGSAIPASPQLVSESGGFDGWLSHKILKPVLLFLRIPALALLGVIMGSRRGGGKKSKGRKGSAAAASQQLASDSGSFDGWPSLESLKPVLLFLCVPALVALGVIVGGGLPKPVLYLSGLIIGLIVAMSTFKTVEITVVCILLYLPFAKSYVIPVLPGLNGTNMLIMLGLGTAFMYASREKVKFVVWPPGSSLVIAFGIYTALSAFTILQHPGGGSLLSSEILSFKSWLDQFIIYLILVCLIRDKEGAKRAVVYIMIGTMAVVIHTIPEMLEKMGRSSIEKSRIIGPQLQSNNFGGFVAYTLLPMLAFFMVFIKDIRAWMLTPYFLLAIKVLITTFSRGAYVAVALGGLLVGYYRGKAFLMGVAVFAICVVAAFPAVIPESISARMGGLIGSEEAATSAPEEEKLDKSSSTRFVMWEAAGQMMIESPVLGKGFKGFQFLKDQYVEGDHPEDDPHSMYFYLGSQMGIPALVLFFCIMGYMFKLGRFHSKNKHDRFIRAVGIGGAAIPVCYAVICIFGSRATALNFTIYFWAYLVVLQVLKKASDEGLLEQVSGITGKSSSRSKRSRRNTAGSQSDSVLAMESANDPQLELKPRSKRRVAERAPKRGAAAFMEKEAERKALEAQAQIQIEALRANRQGKGTSLAAQSTDIQQQPYETRAARRAREAAEQAASAGRQKRQRGG